MGREEKPQVFGSSKVADRRAAPPLHAPSGSLTPIDPVEYEALVADWSALLDAIKARLHSAVGEMTLALETTETLGSVREYAWRLRQSAVDCVAALDELHVSLLQEASHLYQSCENDR